MDIPKLVGMIQNRDIQTNLFIFILCVSLIQFFDTKIIMGVGLFIFIILNYEHIISVGNTDTKVKGEIKKHDISDDMYYNTTIHDLLIQLKIYKKYNKVSYKDGVKYMRKFFKTIKILENNDIYNHNHYFENALIYLQTSINHFQSIIFHFHNF